MRQQVTIFSLGVNDVESMTTWYSEKFGWIPIKNNDGAVFFRLDRLVLILVQEDKLAQHMNVWQDGAGFKRFTLTIGFNSEKEVDEIFNELQQKGVMIIKEPAKVEGGTYKGYIADPEDNFWELAFYPFTITDKAAEWLVSPEIIYQS